MPHLILEYSAELEPAIKAGDLVAIGHGIMRESGLFKPQAIKTRSHKTTDYRVGEGSGEFLHALVYLMEGREEAQKASLTSALFNAFDPLIPASASLTVDIRDLAPGTYKKRG